MRLYRNYDLSACSLLLYTVFEQTSRYYISLTFQLEISTASTILADFSAIGGKLFRVTARFLCINGMLNIEKLKR